MKRKTFEEWKEEYIQKEGCGYANLVFGAFHSSDEYIEHQEKLAKDRFAEMGRLQNCNLEWKQKHKYLEKERDLLLKENVKLKRSLSLKTCTQCGEVAMRLSGLKMWDKNLKLKACVRDLAQGLIEVDQNSGNLGTARGFAQFSLKKNAEIIKECEE